MINRLRSGTQESVGLQLLEECIFASPGQGERIYFRLLFTTTAGATSFANLRTVNNVQYATYKEACHVLGLLENDNEWI